MADSADWAESDEFLDDHQPDTRANPIPAEEYRAEFLKHKDKTIKDAWLRAKQGVKTLLRNRYEYTTLKDDEIRLLSIAKGSGNDPIKCTMFIKPLRAVRKKYEALSYHWGTSDADTARNLLYIAESRMVNVVRQATGQPAQPKHFLVHDNLYSALRHLRSEEKSVVLWVDAICINQRDTLEGRKEKQKQVQRMADIYNSAFNVCIWLGPADAQTDIAMDFVSRIVRLEEFDGLIKEESTKSEWEAFTYLMKWEWFSRRWVVQEVALARTATVHCGAKKVNWIDFADAVALFVTKLEEIKRLFSDPGALIDIEAYGAIVLVDSISNLSRKSAEGDIQEHLVGLETLVSSLLFFSTSNPYDTIYSLLSLASDTPQKYAMNTLQALDAPTNGRPKKKVFQMTVDYKKTPMEVFVEFIKQCIYTSGSLDIVCRHWAPDIKGTAFPSWILKISDSSFGTPEDALQGRRNGDSFVGAPYRDSRKCYNASRGTVAQIQFGPLGPEAAPGTVRRRSTGSLTGSLDSSVISLPSPWDLSVHGVMNAKGFQLATISESSSRIVRGMINRDWLEKAGWKRASKPPMTNVPDKLWRTLVADRSPDGGNSPGWYRRACLQCLTDKAITDVNGDMDVSYLRVSSKKSRSDITMQFLKRVRSVVWNRQFFLAKLWCDQCKKDGHDILTCVCPASRRQSTVTDMQKIAVANAVAAAAAAAAASANGGSPTTAISCSAIDTAEIEEQEDQLLYGLAPDRARKGDLICILAGCTVPVVLRRHKNANQERYYELVGEAFVYGKMDGEAMAGLHREALEEKLQWFTLR